DVRDRGPRLASEDHRPAEALRYRNGPRRDGQSVCSDSRWSEIFGTTAAARLSGIVLCRSELACDSEVIPPTDSNVALYTVPTHAKTAYTGGRRNELLALVLLVGLCVGSRARHQPARSP